MFAEIKRKLFHLLGLMYVAGVLFIPRPILIAVIVILFVVNGAVELARLRHSGVSTFFSDNFGGLFREEERARLTGVFWMLLGVLSAIVLIPSNKMAATTLLFVIFGDGVASLVGKSLQGPKWPGSPKTISGSAACLVACLTVGAIMLSPEYGWHGVVGGAIAATVLEFGFFSLNDNFAIPAGSSLAFLTLYKIKPYFLSFL